jgi:aldose 1-epimerase
MNHRFNSVAAAVVGMVIIFAGWAPRVARAVVTDDEFGKLPDGSAIHRWTITNTGGASVAIISYGATIVSLNVPDRDGKLGDVELGFDQLDSYLTKSPFFGATVGRYGNRIGGARFSLNGVEYRLPANNGKNTLHGGRRGFDKRVWDGMPIDDHTIELTYVSKDGEEGFPGNLTAHVQFSLSDANVLHIDYAATTDKDTVINLTNHSYFNLAGAGNGNVLKHQLTIDAEQITPGDAGLIPTGELAPVDGGPYDFRTPHEIGERIESDDPQMRAGQGYDMNFVLKQRDEGGLHHAATAYEPTSGRVMEVWTTEPGVQLYTSNGMDGSLIGKGGKVYPRYGAFCLETQHFPDSPNKPSFPSTKLKAGDTFHSTTEYRFSTKPAAAAAATGIDISTGWSLVRSGDADGSIEQDAHHGGSTSPHLLRVTATKTAGPLKGHFGATSSVPIAVSDGQWFDVRFAAVTQQGSIGLVFSLESDDGRVLARTTLPEIGRGRGPRSAALTTAPATTPSAWPRYLVALHARAADGHAHLAITPIEPTTIWLDQLTITPRSE